MPKSNTRCKRWSNNASGCLKSPSSPPAAAFTGNLMLSTPRKVSFEESSSDSDSASSCRRNEPQKQAASSQTTLTRKRSLLARPTTSLSLVDLANSYQNGDSDTSLHCPDGERKAKRICSPIVSPRTTLAISKGDTSAASAQPWGQFVEMMIPEDNCRNSPHLFYLDHSNPACSCESSCRLRRSSPYGEYHTKSASRTRCLLSPPSCLHLAKSSLNNNTSSPTKFRLTPRREGGANTEKLIGAFSGLNF